MERHGALIIVALGESVAAADISASRQAVTGSPVPAAVPGLALPAALWWLYSGTGDDHRAEGAFTAAGPGQRPGPALSALVGAGPGGNERDVGEDGIRDRAIHAAGYGPRLE